MSISKLSFSKIKEEIIMEAVAINISPGTAEIIAEKVVKSLRLWVKKRTMITDLDLENFLIKELQKYNKDLAELFKEKEKII